MDNNATFRRLKFTGLLLRSQWVIKLCSKGGIQMKKTLKKKEHKGRNNVSVYANGPCLCKWTVFMHMLFYVWVCLCSESSGAESVIHKCIWI